MSTPTLARVNVYAPPKPDRYYGFGARDFEISLSSPVLDSSMPPPYIARKFFANGDRVLGRSGSDALHELCKALSSRPQDFVTAQLWRYGAYCSWLSANYIWELGPTADSMQSGTGNFMAPVESWAMDRMRWPPQVDKHRFYITPVLPIQGLQHWLAKSGQDMTLPLRALNLSMHARDFNPIADALNNRGLGDGVYAIDGRFNHNVFNHGNNIWAAGLIGQVNGHVRGTLTISGGQYQFAGAFTLDRDRYDANPASRPFPQEGLTSFLGALSGAIGSRDYWINFEGSQEVQLRGTR